MISGKGKSSLIGTSSCASVATCTLRQAVRFVLQRQGLVDRLKVAAKKKKNASQRRFDGAIASFEPLMPLHATAQTTPPLSLLARVVDFQRDHLDVFLQQSRLAPLHYPMLRCMRTTLHLLPANKYDSITKLYNFDGCANVEKRVEMFGMSSAEFKYWSKEIIQILSKEGPMLTRTLTTRIKENAKSNAKYKCQTLTATNGKATVSQSNVGVALQALVNQAKVQYGLGEASHDKFTSDRVMPIEAWRETQRLHGIAPLAVAKDDLPPDKDINQAIIDLMSWYFELYGPASLKDFVWWSGRKVRESRNALQSLLSQKTLKQITVEGLACECFVLSSHEDDILETDDSLPKSVRFLPYEDALIKAYKETRHRFYFFEEKAPGSHVSPDENLQEHVFWRGEAYPTLWIDGQIVGRWKWRNIKGNKKGKGTLEEPVVSISTTRNLSKALKSRLLEELEILCQMLNCSPKEVEFAKPEKK